MKNKQKNEQQQHFHYVDKTEEEESIIENETSEIDNAKAPETRRYIGGDKTTGYCVNIPVTPGPDRDPSIGDPIFA